MIKKISIVFLAFFLVVPVFFYLITNSYSQSITLSEKKVIYDLPYAGILPDNPLYMLKEVRDTVVLFLTRDQMKKAEMLLLSSDKKINMALQLSAKGKSKMVIEMLTAAEKQSQRIPKLVNQSRKQGVAPSEGFVYRLKLSNVKHREEEENLIKSMPQGQEQDMNSVLELNNQVKKQLDSL